MESNSGLRRILRSKQHGEIRSLQRWTARKDKLYKRVKILSPTICGKNGNYLAVRLYAGKGRKMYQVHRLVALTFIPNPKNLEQIDHINQNTKDNRVENLRWVSQSENQFEVKTKVRLGYGKSIAYSIKKRIKVKK